MKIKPLTKGEEKKMFDITEFKEMMELNIWQF